jgi:hypothetical protein
MEARMRVQANGKVRRSRAEWRGICERFKASGLSDAAFCRREGIAKGSFSRWKNLLHASEGEKAAFVEISPPVQPSFTSLEAGEMELVLPGGVCLRWKP